MHVSSLKVKMVKLQLIAIMVLLIHVYLTVTAINDPFWRFLLDKQQNVFSSHQQPIFDKRMIQAFKRSLAIGKCRYRMMVPALDSAD